MQKIVFFYLTVFFHYTIYAQWNTNSNINTPVVIITKSQNNIHSVTDGKGGMISAWDDNRNSATTGSDVYIQRLSNSGFEKWTNNGVAVCSSNGEQQSVAIIESTDGSAIVSWEDSRNGNYDIYAQKIDSNGNALWLANGVAVCNKTTNQKNPKLVSDNAGGAIIVWEDSLNFYWDISAQRINSSGTTVWTTNGVSICASTNTQINPKIDTDGLGGAIIVWQDKRNNVDYDIYTQKINDVGTVQWTANGVVVCNASNTQSNPRVEPDGANGALIGWVDKRNGTDYNIYGQRFNASGVAQWTVNGLGVCTAANNQSALDMKYIGATGALFSWKDDRSGGLGVYAQLVSLSGVNQLAVGGIKLSNAPKSINPNTISDANGGAIVAWQDSSSGNWDIKSQKLNSLGAVQWAAGGITVSNAIDDQVNVSQVSDNNGGAVYSWEDHRNGTDYDIYAHHLYFDGNATIGLKEINANHYNAICYPNPITDNSYIKLSNFNYNYNIVIYDYSGKLIEQKSVQQNELFKINNSLYENGVYFYSIKSEKLNTVINGNFISIK